MFFGYDVGVARWPSKIVLELSFYETSKPKELIYSTIIRRAMGTNNKSNNPDGWSKFLRVGKAYVKGAYKLAQAFKRIVD
jgi:hypothetical protein